MIVWRACAQTELAFLRGKQASKDYIKTIFSILTPFAKIHHENDFDFHQDTPQRSSAGLSLWEAWGPLGRQAPFPNLL